MNAALVVAEPSESRSVLSEHLCSAGYSVTVVSTSREAGVLLQIGYPDVLFWWVGKPTVDDLKLARAVKDRELVAPLPIIYINGIRDVRRIVDRLSGLRS
jgi:CheY-like chemotaxis protein